MSAPGDAVERYLDDLVVALRALPPRELRSVLAETEAHLRDDVERRIAAGADPDIAAAAAVAAFGPVGELARAEWHRTRLPLAVLAGRTMSSALLLGGIGAVAVGLSGLVAALLRTAGGAQFVVDVAPGGHLARADCARWLHQDAGATSCHAAAVADWIGEVVWYRIAVGVLGLVLLGAWAGVRRARLVGGGLLPAPVRDAVAATAFVAAAAVMSVRAVDLGVVASGHGSGQWYSAGLVAAAGALVFGLRLVRDLREPVTG